MATFARPDRRLGTMQVLSALGPFVAGCVAMHLLFPLSAGLALALALPTGALLVRVFIVQHDCGHGSFFRSPRSNAILGWICSLCTLTPYANWARQHAQHHAHWNRLDGDCGVDLYSACLTVRAYLALSPVRRFLYRLPRHPIVAHLLLPPIVFLFVYRLPVDSPPAWKRERRAVHWTNAALAILFGALVALVGWRQVALVHVSIMIVASILGVWLFSVQHRFDGSQWASEPDWRFMEAAIGGSSWLDLPRPLRWLSGNIGFHHIHHLNPRVPNYKLARAHEALVELQPVPRLGLRQALAAVSLTLWDEAAGRLVRFRDTVHGAPAALGGVS